MENTKEQDTQKNLNPNQKENLPKAPQEPFRHGKDGMDKEGNTRDPFKKGEEKPGYQDPMKRENAPAKHF